MQRCTTQIPLQGRLMPSCRKDAHQRASSCQILQGLPGLQKNTSPKGVPFLGHLMTEWGWGIQAEAFGQGNSDRYFRDPHGLAETLSALHFSSFSPSTKSCFLPFLSQILILNEYLVFPKPTSTSASEEPNLRHPPFPSPMYGLDQGDKWALPRHLWKLNSGDSGEILQMTLCTRKWVGAWWVHQLASNMNWKCVKIQIERQKFKLVITDVCTEGVQGTTWPTERVCPGANFVGYNERSKASFLHIQREKFYFPCPIQIQSLNGYCVITPNIYRVYHVPSTALGTF